jgi:hypothetical protein
VPRYLRNLAHDSGAHLNSDKSQALWPITPSADILQKYEAAGVPFLRTVGVLVLMVPVGSETYVRTQLLDEVEELRTRMQVLGDFQDARPLFSSVAFACACAVSISYFAHYRSPL